MTLAPSSLPSLPSLRSLPSFTQGGQDDIMAPLAPLTPLRDSGPWKRAKAPEMTGQPIKILKSTP